MSALTPAPGWLIKHPIAHRGLHDITKGCVENSLASFRAAVTAGYSIECDLQASATGEPVVFHDHDLDRMTDHTGLVRKANPAELEKMSLTGSNEMIPSLKEVLQLVDGKTPILIEVKGMRQNNEGLVAGIAGAIKGYEGPLAIMSFDHTLCAQFASLIPDIPRGLTALGNEKSGSNHTKAMSEFDLQFVSYSIRDIPSPFIKNMRNAGLPVITWTVKTPEQEALSYLHADQITFEGYLPPTNLQRPDRHAQSNGAQGK